MTSHLPNVLSSGTSTELQGGPHPTKMIIPTDLTEGFLTEASWMCLSNDADDLQGVWSHSEIVKMRLRWADINTPKVCKVDLGLPKGSFDPLLIPLLGAVSGV